MYTEIKMKILSIFFVIFFLPQVTFSYDFPSQSEVKAADLLGDSIDAREFLTSLRGTYQILTAGGKIPEVGDDVGTIQPSANPNEEEFTFPYCYEVCDPGWLYFSPETTKVSFDGKSYHLMVEKTGKTLHFSWEPQGDKIIFRNHQYKLVNNSIIVLEFVLARKS